jgi:CHRD domain
MRGLHIGGLVAVAAVALSMTMLPGTAGAVVPLNGGLFAQLNGAREVPPHPGGYGAFSAVVVGPNRLCYSYEVNGIGRPSAAHIHRGRAGVNGPIVIPLRTAATGAPGWVGGGAVTTSTLLTQIRTTPGGFYVNVHTARYPNGAVRGQLRGPLP